MPLKIIGAGYPRTGTTSLQQALETLGFGPCCHMWELLRPEHAWRWLLWRRAFEGKSIDWEKLFRGFAATVDAPGSFFWRKLSRAYPEAKVILTVRDPDSWMRSMQSGTTAAEGQIDASKISALVQTALGKMAPAIARERGSGPDPAPGPARERFLREQFLRNTELVKQEIAPARLLVFDVRDGWEPLCKFLGVPVPQAPFPHENDARDFLDRIARVPTQR
jgi:Sulfotransferase domain